jgi:hypothetical protein
MWCAERKIGEHHHAVPHGIVRAQQDAKKIVKQGQMNLDRMFRKSSKKQEFSKADALKAVAEFVICNDQV